jgi:signal transduction histidine kinase
MNDGPVKVLLVEDSESDAALVKAALNNDTNGRFEVTRVERLSEGLEQLKRSNYDVLLLDLSLPDSSGRETFVRARIHAPEVPILVMTGIMDESLGLDALRHGIQDYLVKGQAYTSQTPRAIRYAIERKNLEMALQTERDNLEIRVRERTVELLEANRAMLSEIALRREAEEAQKHILRRLGVAEETERVRISRELHDQLGQHLTVMKLGLHSLQRQCPCLPNPPPAEAESMPDKQPSAAAQKLRTMLGHDLTPTELGREVLQGQCPFAEDVRNGARKLEMLADGLMRDIHRLAWELHPGVLDDLGLEAALQRYTSEWSANSTIPIDFHCEGMDTNRLPLELETALYRVTQEALNNVLKHAKARRVSVLLERRADLASLIVEDDGIGFDSDAILQAAGTQNKLGLLGMKERIRLAGGTFNIESTIDRGTTVFVRIPLSRDTDNKTTK